MKQWDLQDIRPSRSGRRPTMHSRMHEEPEEEGVTEMEDEDMLDEKDEHVTSSRSRKQDHATKSHGRGQSVSAFNARNIPLKPSPVRLYIKYGSLLLTVCAVIGAFAMHALARATVTIIPQVVTDTVDTELTASSDKSGADLTMSTLSYTLEAETDITAEGIEDVIMYAEGNITIYNEFSESPYRLIKNTRFESDGKVFRIQEGVSVPGYTTTEDGVVIPGEATARVFASEAGEGGNIEPTRFTLPALEGEDEYDSLYAKSTKAFSGGYVGKQSIVNDEERVNTRARLEAALEEKLRAYLAEQHVAGQLFFNESARFSYIDSLQTDVVGDTVSTLLKVEGTISVPVFEENAFVNAITPQVEDTAVTGVYRILRKDGLSFAYTSTTTADMLENNNMINFSVSGPVSFAKELSADTLKEALLGYDKNELTAFAATYPDINSVSYIMHPFWRGSFPENAERLTLEVIIPEE